MSSAWFRRFKKKEIQEFTKFDIESEISEYNIFDVVRLLLPVTKESDLLVHRRIRESFEEGVKMGIQFSKTQSYLVFPVSADHCFRINADWKRSVFGKTPFGKGLDAYLHYLDDEGILASTRDSTEKELGAKTRALLSAPLITAGTQIDWNSLTLVKG